MCLSGEIEAVHTLQWPRTTNDVAMAGYVMHHVSVHARWENTIEASNEINCGNVIVRIGWVDNCERIKTGVVKRGKYGGASC